MGARQDRRKCCRKTYIVVGEVKRQNTGERPPIAGVRSCAWFTGQVCCRGCSSVFQALRAHTSSNVRSRETSVRVETLATKPARGQAVKIVFVSAGNGILPPTSNSKHVFSRRPRLNFLNQGCVHERRPVDPHESVRTEMVFHHRDRLSQEVRA